MSNEKYIQLNEDGFFSFGENAVDDPNTGKDLLNSLTLNEHGAYTTTVEDHDVFVEVYDEPFVVQQIHKQPGLIWQAQAPYGFTTEFSLESLTLDEWDRFHGVDIRGVPFVFNRSAQSDFFDLVDEFDDDSITVENKKINLPDWLQNISDVENENFWSNIYKRDGIPGWELEKPNPALVDALHQIKLNKSRILVLGCGSGNDAAHFAQLGHMVTAVDFSPSAIEKAQEKYAQIKNLTFVQKDIFQLDDNFHDKFDVIYEHTCYCAINPKMRTQLMDVWRKCLVEGGHVLGTFFVHNKFTGPPFGGSEWEIRQRLKKNFIFLYWTRWKKSEGFRKGIELLVYAQKKKG